MKQVYVIVIVSLALWTVVNANDDWQLECPVTQCKCPEEYATNLPHETDCTKFYKCDWCRPVLQDCPLSGIPGYKRLHYNRRLQVCDWPWQAGCANCTKPVVDECSSENEKISNPKDDNTYFECINFKPVLRQCCRGTSFSRTCQDCVKNRAGGICDGTTTPDPNSCEIEGDRNCHECDCRLYYECNWFENTLKWVPRSCKGLYYNPDAKECQPADIARPICEVKCLHVDS
ncbi:Chitin-binding type-2 domain-containing protein [Camponotus japonicus]